jgi:hypothetical protein
MLRDREMYDQIVGIFEGRRFYNEQVWRYAWHHMDLPRIRQLIKVNTPAEELAYF